MTEIELLSAILNRLDLIYTLGLYSFVIVVVVFVIYLLYRFLIKFF